MSICGRIVVHHIRLFSHTSPHNTSVVVGNNLSGDNFYGNVAAVVDGVVLVLTEVILFTGRFRDLPASDPVVEGGICVGQLPKGSESCC